MSALVFLATEPERRPEGLLPAVGKNQAKDGENHPGQLMLGKMAVQWARGTGC